MIAPIIPAPPAARRGVRPSGRGRVARLVLLALLLTFASAAAPAPASAQDVIELPIGTSFTHPPGPGDPITLYRFVGLAGTRINATVFKAGGPASASLYSSAGEVLATSEDASGYLFLYSTLPTDDVYLLSVVRTDSTSAVAVSVKVRPASAYCWVMPAGARNFETKAWFVDAITVPQRALWGEREVQRIADRLGASLDSAGIRGQRSVNCTVHASHASAMAAVKRERQTYARAGYAPTEFRFRYPMSEADDGLPPLPPDTRLHAVCSYMEGGYPKSRLVYAPMFEVPATLAFEDRLSGAITKGFTAAMRKAGVRTGSTFPPTCRLYLDRGEAKAALDRMVAHGAAEQRRDPRSHSVLRLDFRY